MKLINKTNNTIEFQHAGKMLKLEPNAPVECDGPFLSELAKYETVNAYFDQGLVDLVKDEAPAKKSKAKEKSEAGDESKEG